MKTFVTLVPGSNVVKSLSVIPDDAAYAPAQDEIELVGADPSIFTSAAPGQTVTLEGGVLKLNGEALQNASVMITQMPTEG